jgi:copper chaperone CopZ
MTETTISVPEIHCDACKNAIEGALRPLPGVIAADVDVGARRVRVRYGPPASLDSLRQVIEDQGYDVASAGS